MAGAGDYARKRAKDQRERGMRVSHQAESGQVALNSLRVAPSRDTLISQARRLLDLLKGSRRPQVGNLLIDAGSLSLRNLGITCVNE